MSKPDKKSFLKSILAFMKAEGINNKLVYDAEQAEIDFYELEDGDTVAVGAKARVDGQLAEGSFVVPDSENPEASSTYVFVAGELTDIVAPEAEAETEAEAPDEMTALKAENEALKAKVLEFENKVSEKETAILNLTTKNKSLNTVIDKIKAYESEEEIVTGQKEKTPKPETKTTSSSKYGAAITNLKNKKENGL